MGTCYFRLLNQTKKCSLPRLVIFLEPAPALHAWAPIPAEWCEPEGCVHLCLGLGTLVPSRSLSAAKIAAGRLGCIRSAARSAASRPGPSSKDRSDGYSTACSTVDDVGGEVPAIGESSDVSPEWWSQQMLMMGQQGVSPEWWSQQMLMMGEQDDHQAYPSHVPSAGVGISPAEMPVLAFAVARPSSATDEAEVMPSATHLSVVSSSTPHDASQGMPPTIAMPVVAPSSVVLPSAIASRVSPSSPPRLTSSDDRTSHAIAQAFHEGLSDAAGLAGSWSLAAREHHSDDSDDNSWTRSNQSSREGSFKRRANDDNGSREGSFKREKSGGYDSREGNFKRGKSPNSSGAFVGSSVLAAAAAMNLQGSSSSPEERSSP